MKKLSTLALALLAGCGGASTASEAPPVEAHETTGGEEALQFGSLDAAIDGTHRREEDRARDQYRNPRETLTFFGVEPGSRVVELWPGGGWYTSILAPLVRSEGQLTAVAAQNRYLERFQEFLATRPDLYDGIELVVVEPADGTELSFGPDGSADVVLTFRSVHGWLRSNVEDEVFAAAFRVLRPGGVLGVVQHRADSGTDRETMARTGYVTEELVIETAQAAGFVLDERSEVNANPNDTHDHPEGVWSLPPALRGDDADRDRRAAIGESDRMTLRFRKPE